MSTSWATCMTGMRRAPSLRRCTWRPESKAHLPYALDDHGLRSTLARLLGALSQTISTSSSCMTRCLAQVRWDSSGALQEAPPLDCPQCTIMGVKSWKIGSCHPAWRETRCVALQSLSQQPAVMWPTWNAVPSWKEISTSSMERRSGSPTASLQIFSPWHAVQGNQEWVVSACCLWKRRCLEWSAERWSAQVPGHLEPPISPLMTSRSLRAISLERKAKAFSIWCKISIMKDLPFALWALALPGCAWRNHWNLLLGLWLVQVFFCGYSMLFLCFELFFTI